MEYIYSVMLLHKAGKEITEDAVKKVLEAAGVKVEDSRIKALIAALKDVNIDEAIKNASLAQVQAAPQAQATAEEAKKPEEKKEEKKKDEKKSNEEAAAGLSALFG